MARWYIARPIEKADATELMAYQALNTLDDSWTIRWAYEYLDGNILREGDFLILGPNGRVLVLEVKKRVRVYPRSGRSDGGRRRVPDAILQLRKEIAGVLSALKSEYEADPLDREVPFINGALFSGEGDDFIRASSNHPVALLAGVSHLAQLPKYWAQLTSTKDSANSEHTRNLFHAVYGDASANAEAEFLKSTDQLILDRLTADMGLLDSLSENRQLVVRGGPGCGKTWLADRLARKWADAGENVLLLCYNKALGNSFSEDMEMSPKPKRGGGSLTVHTWESLATWLLELRPADREVENHPESPRDNTYYEQTLPALMLAAVTDKDFRPCFDALVVDEAQDHNTEWWPIYLALLHQREKARIGMFYDPAQRPSFRNKNGFDPRVVTQEFSQPAHFHIRSTRRYTRPVFDYLCSLESPQTKALIEGLHDDGKLLIGPEVVHRHNVASIKDAKVKAARLLTKWFKDGLFDASDVLLLTRHDPFSPTRTWFTENEGFAKMIITPAHDPEARAQNKLRVTSFHKAKGLDARAVVLLDTLPWSDLRSGDREGFWTAASRARQLLAIVEMRD